MCIDFDKFPFIIKIEKDDIGFIARKETITQKSAVPI